MDEKKKKIMISISLIVVLILVITGISYAAFTFIGQGNKVNQITTGTIQMNYEEGTNVIRLNNALPTTDETGKVRLNDGEYFDFSVTTNITGDALINWEIAAEDFLDNTFDGSNVKFYLTKLVGGNEVEVSSSLPAVYNEQTSENKKTGRPANMMSLLTGSTSTQGEEIINYRLRLYVDENYNPQGDGGGLIFKTRINVYGKVSTEVELPVIRKMFGYDPGTHMYMRDIEDFGDYTYKTKVTTIVTKKDTMIPETAITITNGKGNYWDESEVGDDSVIAYMEDDGSGNGTYKVTIGGKGGIMANVDSSYTFHEFSELKRIDLSNYDTSNVENMSYMFASNNSLISLDLSNFDTSNVTNMTYMFGNYTGSCRNLNTIDLSSFDTSNVTDMSSMFSGCSNLTGLDLGNFDTSKVTNMYSMFEDCSNLTSLNLSGFDTSNVTDMSGMFSNCSSLTSLDLTSFNTSALQTHAYMFFSCANLINVTVSNLWTCDVYGADDAYVFGGCGTDHVTVV